MTGWETIALGAAIVCAEALEIYLIVRLIGWIKKRVGR